VLWEEYRGLHPDRYGYSRYVAPGFMLRVGRLEASRCRANGTNGKQICKKMGTAAVRDRNNRSWADATLRQSSRAARDLEPDVVATPKIGKHTSPTSPKTRFGMPAWLQGRGDKTGRCPWELSKFRQVAQQIG
jgi:hypothetical protein